MKMEESKSTNPPTRLPPHRRLRALRTHRLRLHHHLHHLLPPDFQIPALPERSPPRPLDPPLRHPAGPLDPLRRRPRPQMDPGRPLLPLHGPEALPGVGDAGPVGPRVVGGRAGAQLVLAAAVGGGGRGGEGQAAGRVGGEGGEGCQCWVGRGGL